MAIKRTAKEIGNDAENSAIKFLQRNGYKIIERNYYTRFGEIDIIALDGKTVAFIEVKFRRTDNHGSPYEFVTAYKKEHLRKAAWCYVKQKSLVGRDFRFDVVSIADDKIELFKNAFV